MRLDKYILEKFDLRSRTYAENLIKTGGVLVNGVKITKTAYDVTDEHVEIVDSNDYASQGAYKLEEAFRVFDINVKGKICADIGCSNGGFTDCLLRRGAERVIAVDVAECALPKHLLDGGKVEFIRANARDLPKDFPKVRFACSDLSFISLKLVFPQIYGILEDGAEAVTLVKPQFELDKNSLTKNGIVTNEKLRKRAVDAVVSFAAEVGFDILGLSEAPIRFKTKNVEYLLYLRK